MAITTPIQLLHSPDKQFNPSMLDVGEYVWFQERKYPDKDIMIDKAILCVRLNINGLSFVRDRKVYPDTGYVITSGENGTVNVHGKIKLHEGIGYHDGEWHGRIEDGITYPDYVRAIRDDRRGDDDTPGDEEAA